MFPEEDPNGRHVVQGLTARVKEHAERPRIGDADRAEELRVAAGCHETPDKEQEMTADTLVAVLGQAERIGRPHLRRPELDDTGGSRSRTTRP